VIHHYYHLYADGAFEQPLAEHIEAISKITEPIEVKVGLVGSPINLDRAANALPDAWKVCALANKGWEQVTLKALHRDAPELNGAVLYAHTKGAANPSKVNDAWRRCMTRNVIERWKANLQMNADVIGCHWLTPQQHPESVQIPYFGGNFWWASSAYIRTLNEPSMESRYHAEAWLGTGDPRALDLAPGWPGLHCTSH
jgi:hypothetical protein